MGGCNVNYAQMETFFSAESNCVKRWSFYSFCVTANLHMISNPVGREPGNSLMKLEIDPEHVATAGGTQITKLGQVS